MTHLREIKTVVLYSSVSIAFVLELCFNLDNFQHYITLFQIKIWNGVFFSVLESSSVFGSVFSFVFLWWHFLSAISLTGFRDITIHNYICENCNPIENTNRLKNVLTKRKWAEKRKRPMWQTSESYPKKRLFSLSISLSLKSVARNAKSDFELLFPSEYFYQFIPHQITSMVLIYIIFTEKVKINWIFSSNKQC